MLTGLAKLVEPATSRGSRHGDRADRLRWLPQHGRLGVGTGPDRADARAEPGVRVAHRVRGRLDRALPPDLGCEAFAFAQGGRVVAEE